MRSFPSNAVKSLRQVPSKLFIIVHFFELQPKILLSHKKLSASANSQSETFFEILESVNEILESFFENLESFFFEKVEDF